MLTITVKTGIQGNSLRMTIPDPIVKALELKDGDFVEVGVDDNKMVVWKKRLGE